MSDLLIITCKGMEKVMPNTQYKQYILLLDPNDKDEAKLINYLTSKHTRKHKDSYSTLLRVAVKKMMDEETKQGE